MDLMLGGEWEGSIFLLKTFETFVNALTRLTALGAQRSGEPQPGMAETPALRTGCLPRVG